MKKTIPFILAFALCIILCACGNANDTTSPADQNNAPAIEDEEMSESDIEDAVEKEAIRAVLGRLNGSGYNLDESEYKIGSIVKLDNDEYEVSGTLYLYNKYGSLEDVATFACTKIWIQENGTAANVGSVDINY